MSNYAVYYVDPDRPLTEAEYDALRFTYRAREAEWRYWQAKAAEARRRSRRVLLILGIGWAVALALLILGAALKAGAL